MGKRKGPVTGYRSWTDKKTGRFYQRVKPIDGGPEKAIHGEPGTIEWQRECILAAGGLSPVRPLARQPGSGADKPWLVAVEEYLHSQPFLDRRPATQELRGSALRALSKRLRADTTLGEIDAAVVAELVANDTPSMRSIYTETIRVLYRCHKLADPTFDDDHPRQKRYRSKEGYKPAEDHVIDALRATWRLGTLERTLIETGWCTAARRGDLIRMRWGDIVDHIHPVTGEAVRMVRITQQKTGNDQPSKLSAECLEALEAYRWERQSIDLVMDRANAKRQRETAGRPKALRGLARRKAEPDIIFRSKLGYPLSEDMYSETMRNAFIEAGLPVRQNGMPTYENSYSGHSLRRGGATEAAEAGASENQLMAQGGWTTGEMPAHYTKKARRKILAIQVAELREVFAAKKAEAKARVKAGGGPQVIMIPIPKRNDSGTV